jgi:hypothetical protein
MDRKWSLQFLRAICWFTEESSLNGSQEVIIRGSYHEVMYNDKLEKKKN